MTISRPSSMSLEHEKRTKLQHFLVMKAYNLRKGKQTLAQQFQPFKQYDGLHAYLDINTLCTYLSIPFVRRQQLCQIFATSDRIEFETFLRFLQTAIIQAVHQETSCLPCPPISNNQLVCFAPSFISSTRPPPAPGLWKKREITIQERITEYTKIDEDGKPQHLTEKEKHQTEIIHMESLDGVFAHREITQFEQLEQLNEEVVVHETGREEFIHLKSLYDEISRFESTTPQRQPEECEQAPPSPTIKRDPSNMESFQGFQPFYQEEYLDPMVEEQVTHDAYQMPFEPR